MRQQRTRLVINAGNLLELLGAMCAVTGVYLIVGLGFALIAAAILLIVAAEFIYDAQQWRIPLPHRPRPKQRLNELTQARRRRLRASWQRRTAAVTRWRVKRRSR